MCVLVLPAGVLASTASQSYRVVGVADGDTLTALSERRMMKVRLANIDAPEKSQAFGKVSRLSLSALCYGREAVLEVQSVDRYGRSVAKVRCDGVDVNRAQVERGMAWVYTRYNQDSTLLPVELAARSAQRGLWMDAHAVAPWQFRRRK